MDDGTASGKTREVVRERRLSARMMGVWWDRRGERPLPAPEDIGADQLPDLWPSCFTLVLRAPPPASVFRYLGPAIAAASGLSAPPPSVADLPSGGLLDFVTRDLAEVLASRVPIVSSGELVGPDGVTLVFRGILLPMSRDREVIDQVIGGARCRILRP